MARLDVYLLPGGAMALDCQSDELDHLTSRFTVPLVAAEEAATRIAGFHPVFDIAGEARVMATHLAGAIPAKALKKCIGSLRLHEHEVQRALDTLIGSY